MIEQVCDISQQTYSLKLLSFSKTKYLWLNFYIFSTFHPFLSTSLISSLYCNFSFSVGEEVKVVKKGKQAAPNQRRKRGRLMSSSEEEGRPATPEPEPVLEPLPKKKRGRSKKAPPPPPPPRPATPPPPPANSK